MNKDTFVAAAGLALRGIDSPARPIALMDSGVGGLPYLEAARRILPAERYVYLADRAGFPYGTKGRDEVKAIVIDRIGRLVAAFNPKAVVIACNTASQAALVAAREAFPGLPIVGTVPAVKPAALRTRNGVIGVMATEQALVDPYLDELIASHAPGTRVIREPAQDLVSFVEHDFIASDENSRREAVLSHVRRLLAAGADEIVLACTHFLHVADDIRLAAASLAAEGCGKAGMEVVDSREGVARRLREVLAEGEALAPPQDARPRCDGVFLLSGMPPFEEVYGAFAGRYSLLGPFSLEEGR